MLKQSHFVGLSTCHALKMAGIVVVVMLLWEKKVAKTTLLFTNQAEYILISTDNLSYWFPIFF